MTTLRYEDKGDEVKRLQRILKTQGFFKGEILGNFLKRTEEAVILFQQSHLGPKGMPLAVDGVVGGDTWWALEHPSGPPQISAIPGKIPAGLTQRRTKQLEIALAEHAKGVREEPDGSNWGPEIEKFGGIKGAPWCCYFWSWCNRQCFDGYSLGAKIGHCKTAWEKAGSLGMVHKKGEYLPIPGDAFVMLYRNEKGDLTGTGHIGFVLRVEVEGSKAVAINTVEGNAGNRVKVGRRELAGKDIVGFINNFPGDEQPAGWESGLVSVADIAGDTTR